MGNLPSMPSGWSIIPKVSTKTKIICLLNMLAPIPVFLVLSQNSILGILLSLIIGFLLSFLILLYECKSKPVDEKNKPDYKKISYLSLSTTIVFLIYGILYAIAPFLQRTPVTKIVGVIFQSVLGALAVGLISFFTMFSIMKKFTFCM